MFDKNINLHFHCTNIHIYSNEYLYFKKIQYLLNRLFLAKIYTTRCKSFFFFFLVCYIYIYHNSKTVENRTVENGTVKSIPPCYKLLNLRYNVYLNFFKIYSVLYFYGESIMRFFSFNEKSIIILCLTRLKIFFLYF